MTSPTNLFRLPFAEDVSAGERFAALARQAAARLQFLKLADDLETRGALAEADAILAAHAMEIA